MTIPAPNLPDHYLCRLEGTMAGEPCANVLAVRDDVGGRGVDTVAIFMGSELTDTLTSATGTAYRAVISNGRTYQNFHVVQYDATDPTVRDLALTGGDKTGTSAAHALPPQIALVVSLTTGLASRRKRGRIYDYGFTEASNDATGVCDATTRTAVDNFWTLYSNNLATQDITLGVLSRGWINEGPGDTRPSFSQSFADVTALSVRDNKWDTIRSRVPS